MSEPITRREVLGIVGAGTAVALALGEDTAAATDKVSAKPLRLGKPTARQATALPVKGLTFSSNVSPDGRALSLLFDKSMQFEMARGDKTLAQTWVASWSVPQQFAEQPQSVVYRVGLRGTADLSSGSSALVTVQVGNASQALEIGYGAQNDEGEIRIDLLAPSPMTRVVTKLPDGKEQISLKPALPPELPVTISVTLTRTEAKQEGVVHIGTLEINVLADSYA